MLRAAFGFIACHLFAQHILAIISLMGGRYAGGGPAHTPGKGSGGVLVPGHRTQHLVALVMEDSMCPGKVEAVVGTQSWAHQWWQWWAMRTPREAGPLVVSHVSSPGDRGREQCPVTGPLEAVAEGHTHC